MSYAARVLFTAVAGGASRSQALKIAAGAGGPARLRPAAAQKLVETVDTEELRAAAPFSLAALEPDSELSQVDLGFSVLLVAAVFLAAVAVFMNTFTGNVAVTTGQPADLLLVHCLAFGAYVLAALGFDKTTGPFKWLRLAVAAVLFLLHPFAAAFGALAYLIAVPIPFGPSTAKSTSTTLKWGAAAAAAGLPANFLVDVRRGSEAPKSDSKSASAQGLLQSVLGERRAIAFGSLLRADDSPASLLRVARLVARRRTVALQSAFLGGAALCLGLGIFTLANMVVGWTMVIPG